VVSGTNNHGSALGDRGRTLTGHPREPRTKLLQPSQATRWFGEPEMSPSRFFGAGLVGRRYPRRKLRYPVFEGHS
jgi:hypothetical protein